MNILPDLKILSLFTMGTFPTHLLQESVAEGLASLLRRVKKMQQENAVLKHRLSALAEHPGLEKPTLEKLEIFQSQFLSQDAHFMLLCQDIVACQKGNLPGVMNAHEALIKLVEELALMMKNFRELKRRFESEVIAVGVPPEAEN